MRVAVFYIFSLLACIFGAFAITRKSPVHSALMLVLAILSLSVVYLALGAAFLAMAQVFVYAGGIMVLFLFVIMLVGTKPSVVGDRWRQGAGMGLIAALFAGGLIFASQPYIEGAIRIIEVGPQELAAVLIGVNGVLGAHAFSFELASALVLAAIIGALLLSRREVDDDHRG